MTVLVIFVVCWALVSLATRAVRSGAPGLVAVFVLLPLALLAVLIEWALFF